VPRNTGVPPRTSGSFTITSPASFTLGAFGPDALNTSLLSAGPRRGSPTQAAEAGVSAPGHWSRGAGFPRTVAPLLLRWRSHPLTRVVLRPWMNTGSTPIENKWFIRVHRRLAATQKTGRGARLLAACLCAESNRIRGIICTETGRKCARKTPRINPNPIPPNPGCLLREAHPQRFGLWRAHALSCHPRSQSHLRPPWKGLWRGWWHTNPPRFRW
jgi:hypothetical protein